MVQVDCFVGLDPAAGYLVARHLDFGFLNFAVAALDPIAIAVHLLDLAVAIDQSLAVVALVATALEGFCLPTLAHGLDLSSVIVRKL